MAKKKITQITVRQMYKYLETAIAEGNGDKYLVVSDDNEGNGFHGCFYGITPMDTESMELVSDSQINDPNKLMIIG